MPFLPPNQQRQSTEGTSFSAHYLEICLLKYLNATHPSDHSHLRLLKCNVTSMWSLRWHFTNKLLGHLTVLKVTVCHTAGHYSKEYDDWNSAILRLRRNCSSDGAEEQTTEVPPHFQKWNLSERERRWNWGWVWTDPDEVCEVLEHADADLVQIVEEHVEHRQQVTTSDVLADNQCQLVNWERQRPSHLPLKQHTLSQCTEWSDAIESIVAIRPPFCGYNTT